MCSVWSCLLNSPALSLINVLVHLYCSARLSESWEFPYYHWFNTVGYLVNQGVWLFHDCSKNSNTAVQKSHQRNILLTPGKKRNNLSEFWLADLPCECMEKTKRQKFGFFIARDCLSIMKFGRRATRPSPKPTYIVARSKERKTW